MCQSIFVRAVYADGSPNPELPTAEFVVPADFTPAYPTCTCWIGDKEGDGATLRHTFVEECLRPFLEKAGFGDIIIEMR